MLRGNPAAVFGAAMVATNSRVAWAELEVSIGVRGDGIRQNSC